MTSSPKPLKSGAKRIRAEGAVDVWNIKLKRVKKFLKGWGQSLRGHTKKYKRILQEELLKIEKMEEAQIRPSDILERKIFIQTAFLRLLKEEELYGHKKVKLQMVDRG